MKFKDYSCSGHIKTFDAMKGMLIIAVVLVHILVDQGTDGALSNALGLKYTDNGLIAMAAYLCLISFFIISGYFFRKGRSMSENMKKRVLKLFTVITICILVLPLAMYAYLFALDHLFITQNPTLDMYFDSHIKMIFGSRFMFMPYGEMYVFPHVIFTEIGYYFLQTMVTAFLIFFLIYERIMDDWRKVAASILILLTITFVFIQFLVVPPFYLDLGPLAAAFMIVGAKLGEKRYVEKVELEGKWKSKRFFLVFFVSLIVAVVMLSLFPIETRFNMSLLGHNGGFSAYTYFIEALACCVAFFCIFVFVAKIPIISDILCLFGRHTLGILLLNSFVFKAITALFYTLPIYHDLPVLPLWSSIVLWIVTLIVLLIITVYGQKLLVRAHEKIASKN